MAAPQVADLELVLRRASMAARGAPPPDADLAAVARAVAAEAAAEAAAAESAAAAGTGAAGVPRHPVADAVEAAAAAAAAAAGPPRAAPGAKHSRGGSYSTLNVVLEAAPAPDTMPGASLWAAVRRAAAAPWQPGFSWRAFLVRHFTYFRAHLAYFMFISLAGGTAMYFIEGPGHVAYVDALFMAASAACVTGLSVMDLPAMTLASKIIMLLLMLAGSNVLMSVVPVLLRRHYFVRAVAGKVQDEAERAAAVEAQVEYRALGIVARVVFAYVFGALAVVVIVLGCYFQLSAAGRVYTGPGREPWWLALYVAVSSFNNAGFALYSSNMVPFVDDYLVLSLVSALILMGNVAYPVLFRAIIAAEARLKPDDAALRLLLDRPRRCYTHMFPAYDTRVVALAVLLFTLTEYVLFMALDYNLPVLAGFPGHVRSLIAYFQAVSTRTAGFNTIDLSTISPAVQVVYMLMMYVGAYPFILAVRKSSQASRIAPQKADGRARGGSVSEITTGDATPATSRVRRTSLGGGGSVGRATGVQLGGSSRSLASFGGGGGGGGGGDSIGRASLRRPPSSRDGEVASIQRMASYLDRGLEATATTDAAGAPGVSTSQTARNVMSRDLLWLFAALVVICIADNSRLMTEPHPQYMGVFGILFELASAYGTVGLTLGYPGSVLSLAAEFSVVSKLVVIAVMLAGRHRGLPASIDSAVYLPELLNTKAPEEEPVDASLAQITMAVVHRGATLARRPSFGTIRDLWGPQPTTVMVDTARVAAGALEPDAGFLAAIGSPAARTAPPPPPATSLTPVTLPPRTASFNVVRGGFGVAGGGSDSGSGKGSSLRSVTSLPVMNAGAAHAADPTPPLRLRFEDATAPPRTRDAASLPPPATDAARPPQSATAATAPSTGRSSFGDLTLVAVEEGSSPSE